MWFTVHCNSMIIGIQRKSVCEYNRHMGYDQHTEALYKGLRCIAEKDASCGHNRGAILVLNNLKAKNTKTYISDMHEKEF